MIPTVRLIDDNVLVQVIDPSEATAGGVLLPDCSRFGRSQDLQYTRRGRVVAVGPGKRRPETSWVTIKGYLGTRDARDPRGPGREPVSARVGDEVLWRQHGEIRDLRPVSFNDGRSYYVMPERFLLAVLEEVSS